MIYIYTDCSVNPQTKKGIGSYIITNNLDVRERDIVDLYLENVTSTLGELLTIKHILNNYIFDENDKIYLYTDCKTFLDLIKRRQYENHIINHKNYQLYTELINLVNKYGINIVWLKGHASQKNNIHERIFSIVDKHCRNILRHN